MATAAAGVLGLGLLAVAQPAVGAHQNGPHVKRHYTHHHGLKKATNGLIAFVRDGKICTANATGGNLTKLTGTRGNQRPHFSPDGSRISFLHRTPARLGRLGHGPRTEATSNA